MLYGWRKEAPSAKDKLASGVLMSAPPPPPSASLRGRTNGRNGVLDQHRNDCVAHAVARALQVALTAPGMPPAPLPSRDWIYYLSGVQSETQAQDNGRYIRDAMGAVRALGWPDEQTWPYGRWPEHPGGEAHRLAHDRHALSYHRVTDELGQARRLEISSLIAQGYPIVFGTRVTPAFEAQDGRAPLQPDSLEPDLGGHAIALLEYDELGIGFCNSWSAEWAADGWGRLSWDWVTSSLVSDVWAVEIRPGGAP